MQFFSQAVTPMKISGMVFSALILASIIYVLASYGRSFVVCRVPINKSEKVVAALRLNWTSMRALDAFETWGFIWVANSHKALFTSILAVIFLIMSNVLFAVWLFKTSLQYS